MTRVRRLLMVALVVVIGGVALCGVTTPAVAKDEDCVSTTILKNDECGYKDDGKGTGIMDVLGIAIDILTLGIGTAATLGIVISGIQYLTAGDNAGQIQKAKTRIFHIVIGLAIYAVFWGVLQFLLPGGLFGDGS